MVSVLNRKDDVDCAFAQRTGGLFMRLVYLIEAFEVDSVEARLEDYIVFFDLHEVEEQVGVAHLCHIAHLIIFVALSADETHLLLFLRCFVLLRKKELLILLDLLAFHHFLFL